MHTYMCVCICMCVSMYIYVYLCKYIYIHIFFFLSRTSGKAVFFELVGQEDLLRNQQLSRAPVL